MGSPIKRFIDGVVYWREERILIRWWNLRKAVIKHKRWYRRFTREQKRKRKEEWLEWSQSQCQDAPTDGYQMPPGASSFRKYFK